MGGSYTYVSVVWPQDVVEQGLPRRWYITYITMASHPANKQSTIFALAMEVVYQIYSYLTDRQQIYNPFPCWPGRRKLTKLSMNFLNTSRCKGPAQARARACDGTNSGISSTSVHNITTCYVKDAHQMFYRGRDYTRATAL